jgi:hypothetical protein
MIPQMRPMRCIASLLLGSIVANCASQNPAPLIAVDLDGRVRSLAPRRDQVAVVIVFLATDCPIANRTLPELSALQARYEPRHIPFFHIYPNPEDSAGVIRHHRADYSLSPDAYRDPDHSLARRLGAHRTPEVVVLATDGTPIYQGRINDQFSAIGISRPEATRHDLAEVLESVVAGAAPSGVIQPAVGCSFRAPE